MGQPPIAAAPVGAAVLDVAAELDPEPVVVALNEEEVALGLDELVAAGALLARWADELVVELEPPQAASTMAATTASGERPSS